LRFAVTPDVWQLNDFDTLFHDSSFSIPSFLATLPVTEWCHFLSLNNVLSYYDLCVTFELSLGAEEQFTVPPNTIQVISEAVFIASHLTDTDTYMKIHKLNTTQKPNNAKYRKKTELLWFSRLLRHLARNRDELIQQCQALSYSIIPSLEFTVRVSLLRTTRSSKVIDFVTNQKHV